MQICLGSSAPRAVALGMCSLAPAEVDRGGRRVAPEQSLGHQMVIREVLKDLSAGEGSRINRAMRTLQR